MEHFDVVIVGAGVSGISAAVHLEKAFPAKRYAILEGRSSLGGTWDLFRYPGIRSDSDLYTFGFSFKPWQGEKCLADGAAILAYLKETAGEYGVERHIRYRHEAMRAEWSSETGTWTVEVHRADTGEQLRLSCHMLLMCSGYYNYRQGYLPKFDGVERFEGRVIHPQQWPEDLDYAGKRIAVIGSGATAVTLVPAMAEKAAHVVMVQRSPTYVLSWPAVDRLANALQRLLPARWAHAITRWKYIVLQQGIYRLARRYPAAVRRWLLSGMRKGLGPDYDIATHFTPKYRPWDQRLCFAPDGDLFAAIRSGKVSVVTDRIATFTERGIKLASGKELDADIIVTATGLDLAPFGGMRFAVDGLPVDVEKTWTYRGAMLEGVPNLICTFGYVNASWTLRADLTSQYACRIIEHMDRTGARQVTPHLRDADRGMGASAFFGLTSGYMQRTGNRFPVQGDHHPWMKRDDYLSERKSFVLDPLEDGALVFGAPPRSSTAPRPAKETVTGPSNRSSAGTPA